MRDNFLEVNQVSTANNNSIERAIEMHGFKLSKRINALVQIGKRASYGSKKRYINIVKPSLKLPFQDINK